MEAQCGEKADDAMRDAYCGRGGHLVLAQQCVARHVEAAPSAVDAFLGDQAVQGSAWEGLGVGVPWSGNATSTDKRRAAVLRRSAACTGGATFRRHCLIFADRS